MYSVPIIPSDLRHEETIIQAANVLEYLQNVINDLFDKIDNRIEKNNKKINELNSRITNAHDKIHSLCGVNKAIKIFIPSKFPALHVFQDIPQTFNEYEIMTTSNDGFENIDDVDDDYYDDNKNDTNDKKPKLYLNKNYEVKSNQEPVTQKMIQEKLQFYHIRNNRTKSKLLGILENQKQGLGPIPRHLSSINSVLLFNTPDNVYDSYKRIHESLLFNNQNRIQIADNSMMALNRNDNNESMSKLEAPPVSITNRMYNDKRMNQQQNLFYTPRLNDAPEIDVPLDLPDLPGIADDVIFDVTENEKIAPSMFIDNLPELPDPIINSTSTETTEQNTTNNYENNGQNEKSISNIRSSDLSIEKIVAAEPSQLQPPLPPPPPPPPPPLPSIDDSISQSIPLPPLPPTSSSSTSNASSSVPTPPPPPPPPSTSTESKLPSSTETKGSKEISFNTGDAHTNLMEAIRQAGGARGGKLRAAADVIRTNNDGNLKKNTNTASGNLMADIHNRLAMRRKGISGTKDKEDEINKSNTIRPIISSRDLLCRVSASIPPPESNSNSSADDTDDSNCDWAD